MKENYSQYSLFAMIKEAICVTEEALFLVLGAHIGNSPLLKVTPWLSYDQHGELIGDGIWVLSSQFSVFNGPLMPATVASLKKSLTLDLVFGLQEEASRYPSYFNRSYFMIG